MNKAKTLGIITLSLALSGCTLGGAKQITMNPETQSTQEQAKQASKLAAIIASGGTASCTITDLNNPQNVSSMAVRGRMMKISGVNEGSNGKVGIILNDTQYTYMWTEGEKVGFKMKISSEANMNEPQSSSDTTQFDTTKTVSNYEDESKFKMECQEGGLTDADFAPPKDVVFSDPTEMTKNIPGMKDLPKMPSGVEE